MCSSDLEEVARIGGYEAIPSTLPLVPAAGADEGTQRRLVRRIRQLLAAEGLSEMVTLSLTDPETNRLLPGWIGEAGAPVVLANALSSELSELRRTPLAGLVRAARLNRAHGASFVGGFEVGTGFARDRDGAVRERRAIAALLCGDWPPRGAERSGPPVDFFDLKGVVQNLLAGLGVPDEEVRWRRPWTWRSSTPARPLAWSWPAGRWGQPGRCIPASRRPSILQGKCGSLSLTSTR